MRARDNWWKLASKWWCPRPTMARVWWHEQPTPESVGRGWARLGVKFYVRSPFSDSLFSCDSAPRLVLYRAPSLHYRSMAYVSMCAPERQLECSARFVVSHLTINLGGRPWVAQDHRERTFRTARRWTRSRPSWRHGAVAGMLTRKQATRYAMRHVHRGGVRIEVACLTQRSGWP